MAKIQIIRGVTIKEALNGVNANFTELYSAVSQAQQDIDNLETALENAGKIDDVRLHDGTSVVKDKVATLPESFKANGGNADTVGGYAPSAFVMATEKGVANGVATLGGDGKVPAAQLPSYVDDVVEGYYNPTDFLFYEDSSFLRDAIAGESGKIYLDLLSRNTYRWSGSAATGFVEISASLALGETASTAYPGDKGKANAESIEQLQTSLSELSGTVSANEDTLNSVAETASTNATSITNITNGTTKVGKAGTADEATVAKKTAGALTIQENGSDVGTFDGSEDKTLNIQHPTKLSGFENDLVKRITLDVLTRDSKGDYSASSTAIGEGWAVVGVQILTSNGYQNIVADVIMSTSGVVTVSTDKALSGISVVVVKLGA